MWPTSSHASLHQVSEDLKDINRLDLDIERPEHETISRAYGQRLVPKLVRILSAKGLEEEVALKALDLLFVCLSNDSLKAELAGADDGSVLINLLKGDAGTTPKVKVAACEVISKLCSFVKCRDLLYDAGLVATLLEVVSDVPEAAAEVFHRLATNRDIVNLILLDEKIIKALVSMLDGDGSLKAKESASFCLALLARREGGIKQLLSAGISSLLEGAKQTTSLALKEASITTLMQICHEYEGKTAVIGASGVETLAACLSSDEKIQTLATAALLGLSTELEAKEKIADLCGPRLFQLRRSLFPPLMANIKHLIASVSEYPAAKKMFEEEAKADEIRLKAQVMA